MRKCDLPRIVSLSDAPTSYLKIATARGQVLFLFDDADPAQCDLALEQASRIGASLREVSTLSVWRAGRGALARLPLVGGWQPGRAPYVPAARPFLIEMAP